MFLNQQDAYVPQGQLAFSIDTENSEKQNQVPWFSCVASTIWTPFTEHWDPLRGIRVTVPPTFSKIQCSLSKSRPWRTRREKQRRKLVPTRVSAMMTPNYLSLFHFECLLLSTKALWIISFEWVCNVKGQRQRHPRWLPQRVWLASLWQWALAWQLTLPNKKTQLSSLFNWESLFSAGKLPPATGRHKNESLYGSTSHEHLCTFR